MEQLASGNQTLQEFIDTARPHEKAAFAQQVDELVDIYRNLIAEATQNNTDITLDPAIKQANAKTIR